MRSNLQYRTAAPTTGAMAVLPKSYGNHNTHPSAPDSNLYSTHHLVTINKLHRHSEEGLSLECMPNNLLLHVILLSRLLS